MKTKFFLIATAALCLAACNKQEIIDGPDDHGKEGDYMIEIAELDQPTKSSPSTVELNLADLVSPSSKNITAQLKKRSGSGWANVDNGVTYSWSATSEDNQKFSGSGTVNQSCNVSAKKAGTGNITVSAAISGTTVATQPVPVKVSDDRALSWTNATTSLTAGEVKTAVLNSNFSGTASISSNNSSFLVGTSENSLNTTTSVTFGTKKSQTIYYKYTGSSQTTVKVDANLGGCIAEINIDIAVISEQDVRDFWEDQIHNYFEYEYDDVMFTAPISTFPWSDWELRYVFIDWDSEFGTSVWSAYYDNATPLKSRNANSLIRTYMESIQK